MSRSAVCELEGVNWRTAGNSVKASQNRLEPDLSWRIHDSVRRICIDETAVFAEFCELLTPQERDKIEIVAGDSARWIDACMHYFPNAARCIDFFHVAQWANKALDDVRISTADKAKREYDRLRREYAQAENEAAEAAKQVEQDYQNALSELAAMPHRDRPSARKIELNAFVTEYERTQAVLSESAQSMPTGRPKKNQLSPEHASSLKGLSDKMAVFKGARFALGHNPENCTDGQNEKIKLIENDYPGLYRAYQLKENLRVFLHMRDEKQAETELNRWIDAAIASNIKPMIKLAEKIRDRHMKNILNSIRCQANSA